MKKIFLPFAIAVCFGSSAFAQFYKYSNEFLSIGVGARALGMSGAQVATVSDVTAGFWNPAGLSLMDKKFEVGLMHSEYFAGIAKYDYASVALPLQDKNRVMALSLIRFGVDDIPNTLFLIEPDGSINYNNVTTFSVADYAALFSYAQSLPIEGLRAGGTLKIIHRTAGSFAHSWGVGIDIGAQYQLKNWRFGALGKDITTTFNAWNFDFTDQEQTIFSETNNIIPGNSIELTAPKIILGAAYNFEFGKTNKISLLPEIDVDVTTDGKRNVLISAKPFSFDPHIGLEAGYGKTIYLRAGVGNFQRVRNIDSSKALTVQPNIGIGLRIKTVDIDYALTNLGDLSGSLYSHVFSIRFGVADKPKAGYGR
ncbi:MAG: PorV/PorQ family protein [Chitinophagales bacterium]|nr:PorV/PorQ family protein [Chitinophagales bacterium]